MGRDPSRVTRGYNTIVTSRLSTIIVRGCGTIVLGLALLVLPAAAQQAAHQAAQQSLQQWTPIGPDGGDAREALNLA